jgi:hypothetical protein
MTAARPDCGKPTSPAYNIPHIDWLRISRAVAFTILTIRLPVPALLENRLAHMRGSHASIVPDRISSAPP